LNGGEGRATTASGRNAAGGLSFSSTQCGFNIRNMPLFPMKTRRQLTYYTDKISISSGVGSAGAYVFSANGCFDPDITGTGGQPMGFDQMMLFYNHYTVIKSRIKVVFNNTSTADAMVGLGVSGSATPLSSNEQIVENGELSFTWCQKAGVNGSIQRITRQISAAQFQGLRNVMDDPNMRGDAANNPAEQLYYHLFVWYPIDSTVVTASIVVVLEYDVMFHEPKKATVSLSKQLIEKRERDAMQRNFEEMKLHAPLVFADTPADEFLVIRAQPGTSLAQANHDMKPSEADCKTNSHFVNFVGCSYA